MSSEHLASAQNLLKGNLASTWDILDGAQGQSDALGIARRFGGAAAAYSLRDIGATNGRVVKVRRDSGETTDPEEDFSANQVSSGVLEDWVNGKLESTLPADVATAAAAYSLRKVKADYTGYAVRIRRTVDDAEVNVAFDSEDKVSASSTILKITGATNATTLGEFLTEDSVNYNAFVHTWYDQAGSNNAVQSTSTNQPQIANTGALLADGLKFNGSSDNFTITNGVSGRSIFAVTNQNIDTTGGGSNGYGQDGISSLLGTTGTNSYIFVSNNNSAFNSYAISIDGAVSDSGQYASNGGTLSSTGGNLGTYGDIPSDTNSLISIIYSSGDPANAWTRLGSGISGNIFMQGSMSEVILYTTDQTDNKFKIESNINNYYGLYTFQGDGFVETLYDQSGNGDDMTQATAGSQPVIVQNGAQVRLENGKPAFKGDGTDDFLEASFFYSAGEVTALSTFSVVSNRADVGDESTIISAGSGISTTYSGFVTSLDKTANGNPFEQRVANATGTKETSLINIARDGDILGSTFFTKDGTHLIKATTEDGTTSNSSAITVGAYRSSTTSGKLRIGATRTFALQRFFDFPIAETMVFRADLRDEGIEDEINQFYNIG